jgi:DNA-binding protein Fis
VIRPQVVAAIRRMAGHHHGIKTIARDLGVARNTVRRYLRQSVNAGVQVRPAARRLSDRQREDARKLFRSSAGYNAVILQGLLAERGVKASIRTVRRTVAALRHGQFRSSQRDPSATAGDDSGAHGRFEKWEFELMKQIAHRRRTSDNDELESALTAHLAQLQRVRTGVTDWRAFLITALNRKADNWLRDRRREERRFTSLDRQLRPEGEETTTLQEHIQRAESSMDDRIALDTVLEEMNPRLKAVWDALIEERWNQVRTANRLGIHRNTLRKALGQIHMLFKRHGF